MLLNQLNANYTFDELAIWKTNLPNAKHTVLPPSNGRPNPLVAGTMVYVSVFSPGAIYALDRQTGKLVWHREIPKFAGSAVHLADGKLFAKTANTLLALKPETGETIWSFCPYGESGETIYSHPAVYRNSIFIGDRRGYLHCLNSRTGATVWSRKTNRAKNCDVNTTPVVMKSTVIIGTNASMASAYDIVSGKNVWSRKLDGPSAYGPFTCAGLVVVVTDSLYYLNPENGHVVRKFSWTNDGVTSAAATGESMVAILRGGWPPQGNIRVVALNKNEMRFTVDYKAFVGFLSYAAETKLVYVSHLEGIDVIHPNDGSVAFRLKRDNAMAGYGAVDVKQKTIYALTDDGWVYALRHPALSSR
jgi:outer membrane protein assembly factor BamB